MVDRKMIRIPRSGDTIQVGTYRIRIKTLHKKAYKTSLRAEYYTFPSPGSVLSPYNQFIEDPPF